MSGHNTILYSREAGVRLLIMTRQLTSISEHCLSKAGIRLSTSHYNQDPHCIQRQAQVNKVRGSDVHIFIDAQCRLMRSLHSLHSLAAQGTVSRHAQEK
jgi:hypothetical protein